MTKRFLQMGPPPLPPRPKDAAERVAELFCAFALGACFLALVVIFAT